MAISRPMPVLAPVTQAVFHGNDFVITPIRPATGPSAGPRAWRVPSRHAPSAFAYTPTIG